MEPIVYYNYDVIDTKIAEHFAEYIKLKHTTYKNEQQTYQEFMLARTKDKNYTMPSDNEYQRHKEKKTSLIAHNSLKEHTKRTKKKRKHDSFLAQEEEINEEKIGTKLEERIDSEYSD